MKTTLINFFFIGILFLTGACTKVVVRAKENKTVPVTQSYSANLASVFEKSRATLEKLGYSLLQADENSNVLETRWEPTTSDSHYLALFGRRDYAANQGGYYKLVVTAEQQGNAVGVTVYTVLQSVSGKLDSSEVLEKRFLSKLSAALRSSQIEVNNVGMYEK